MALLNFLKRKENKFYKILDKVHFNSQNKYSIVQIDNEERLFYIKGAAEKILSKCTKYLDENNHERIILNINKLEEKVQTLTKKGARVLVMDYSKKNIKDEIKDLVFLGMIAIRDELRKEAKEGIELIKSAGIDIIMITGDHKDTAASIAIEAGLIKNKQDIILTSDELNKMSDEEIKGDWFVF